MKLFERIYSSLIENKLKNLLVFLIVTLLGSFISASFSLYHSVNNIKKDLNDEISPIVLIDWNKSNISEEQKQNKISEIMKYDEISITENRYILNTFNYHKYLAKDYEDIFHGSAEYRLIGIDNPMLADYLDDEIRVKEGRLFSQKEIDNGENVLFLIMFNEKEIGYDNIEIGDEISLHLIPDTAIVTELGKGTYPYVRPFPETYLGNLKVIGKAEATEGQYYKYHTEKGMYDKGYVQYVPIKTLENISDELVKIYEQLLIEHPEEFEDVNFEEIGKTSLIETYIRISDGKQLKSFVNDIERLIKDNQVKVYSFADSYNDVGNALNTISIISIIILVVSCVSSIVLLTLVTQVFVHERRHEIGIYMSIGEKKKNVIIQIIIEIMIVGMMGLSVSLFSGKVIGNKLTESLLENQLEQLEEVYDEISSAEYEIKKEEIMETYDSSISIEYVISVYVGGFVVLAFSCIYPTRSILKMNPKKMLM